MAAASSWTVLRSAPLAIAAQPDSAAMLRRKQQNAAKRRTKSDEHTEKKAVRILD